MEHPFGGNGANGKRSEDFIPEQVQSVARHQESVCCRRIVFCELNGEESNVDHSGSFYAHGGLHRRTDAKRSAWLGTSHESGNGSQGRREISHERTSRKGNESGPARCSKEAYDGYRRADDITDSGT